MLHTDGKRWVTHKDTKFWDDAGFLFSNILILHIAVQVTEFIMMQCLICDICR